MKILKFLVAAIALFSLTSCDYEPDYVVEKTDCYAYVITQDVWGEILPEYTQTDPYATKTHKYKKGEWFFYCQLYPEKAALPYVNHCLYNVPREMFRLLTKAEVEQLMQTDKEFAKEAKTWFLLAEDGSPLFEDDSKQRVARRGGMSAFNLFWLFIPALLIAIVSYIAKSMASEPSEKEHAEDDRRVIDWLAVGVVALFIIQAVMLLCFAYYNAFAHFEIDYIIFFCIPIFAYMGLNAYGAFTTNVAILRNYEVTFSWARIIIYVVASFVVGSALTFLISFLAGFENANLWLAIPYLLGIAVSMLAMFGIDMYRQNPKSLKMLPVLALLLTIGVVALILSGVLVAVLIGLWLVLKSHVTSETMKDKNNASLVCTTCNHYGTCTSVGVPCSRHQNWQ